MHNFKLPKLVIQAVFGSCKSISRKYSIFQKCYFPERKMFSCVWLHFKKFSEKNFLVFGKEKGKDKPRKTRTKPRKKNHQRSTGFDGAVLRELQSDDCAVDRDRRCDLTKARSRSTSRDHDLREITIDIAIQRSIERDLAKHRADRDRCSASRDRDRRRSRRTGAREAPRCRTQSSVERQFGFCPCFFGFVFSFFFSKDQKIFFGKFFEMQPNT